MHVGIFYNILRHVNVYVSWLTEKSSNSNLTTFYPNSNYLVLPHRLFEGKQIKLFVFVQALH